MRIKAFITHKINENFIDCQDRFSIGIDAKSMAVADGMGASWQQKIWAELLTTTYTDNKDWLPNEENIKDLCKEWRNRVESYIENLKKENAPENIIYRNERNLKENKSAGATFVGIRFYEDNNWSGVVRGDSCLITWNGNDAEFYTSQNTESFDNYPDYFDSNPYNKGKGTTKEINGKLIEGDYILMVSDPLSDFLLEQKKANNIAERMQQLISISSHDEFEQLVAEWRKLGMHNDDTTAVIIALGAEEPCTDDIDKLIDAEKPADTTATQQEPTQDESAESAIKNTFSDEIKRIIFNIISNAMKFKHHKSKSKVEKIKIMDIIAVEVNKLFSKYSITIKK